MPAPAHTLPIRVVQVDELRDGWLDGFQRYQATTRMLRSDESRTFETGADFIDDWDDAALTDVVLALRSCVERGGTVLAAGESGAIAGFASVEPERFGPSDEYVELTYLHVAASLRGRGLGRRLFRRASSAARELGASRVYIGAHPSVETQAFYRRMGCRISVYVHEPILAREPLDLQLEILVRDAPQ